MDIPELRFCDQVSSSISTWVNNRIQQNSMTTDAGVWAATGTLITRNVRGFSGVKGLQLEDWY